MQWIYYLVININFNKTHKIRAVKEKWEIMSKTHNIYYYKIVLSIYELCDKDIIITNS